MIRNKNKIFGEVNDPGTIVINEELKSNKYVVSDGDYFFDSDGYYNTYAYPSIKSFNSKTNQLLYIRSNGFLSAFDFGVPNRLIGTDANGKLAVFERKTLPPSPPKGRELIAEYYGSTRPDGIIIEQSKKLTGKCWYEIEVAGCGGGGGSGTGLAEYDDLIDGMSGGAGGYYKGVFAIRADEICTIQIGCPGGGAEGYSTNNTNKTADLQFGPNGGAGGYTPRRYVDYGNTGQKQSLERQTQLGGSGKNGGANGGTVYGWLQSVGSGGSKVYSGAGAGGGANGEYGGAGGDSGPFGVSDGSASVSNIGYIGGAGGAGAGSGFGGNGGAGWSNASETYGNGGSSYGGGGGGGCGNGTETELQRAGCGGGGGGAARFVCYNTTTGDLEVLCGGGGGGSGGCSIGPTHIDGRHKGQNGGNNKNSIRGGGANGGTGGTGVSINTKIDVSTSGTTGSRGWIKIWRCV